MSSLRSTRALLRRLRAMPHGPARTAATEWAVRTIDAAGLWDALPEALLDLVECYTFGTPSTAVFTHFAHLTRLHDESPEFFDAADRRNFLWELKWVTNDLARWPQVSLDEVLAAIDDMERRHVEAGHGTQGADHARAVLWTMVGDEDRAREARERWLGSPSGDMDCADCRVGEEMRRLNEAGLVAEVAAMDLPVGGVCNREPGESLRQRAFALLALGDVAESRRLLRRAWEVESSEWTDVVWACLDVRLLLQSGAIERGLVHLRDRVDLVFRTPVEPWTWLRALEHLVAAAASVVDEPDGCGGVLGDCPTGLPGELLSASRGEGIPVVPISADGAGVTLREFLVWAEACARRLAEAFDARNGSSRATERLAAAVGARVFARVEWGEEDVCGLDLPAPDVEEERGALWPGGAGPASSLAAEAERAWGRGDTGAAAALHAAAAELAEEAGEWSVAAVERAEAGACFAHLHRWSRAHEEFLAAWRAMELGVGAGPGDAALLASVLGTWGGVAERVCALAEMLPAARACVAWAHGPGSGEGEGALVLARAQHVRARVEVAVAATLPQAEERREAVLAAIEPLGDVASRLHEAGDLAELASVLELMGEAYRVCGDCEAAADHLEDAYCGFLTVGARTDAARVLDRLAEVLCESGERGRLEGIFAEHL